MDDFNTKNQVDNNEKQKKKTGFNKFAYYNLNNEGYAMNITKYETRIRREIVKLKEAKKAKEAMTGEEKKEWDAKIAKKKGQLINNTDNAIYNYLTAHVQYNNQVNINKIKKTQKSIAEELCLERTAVSRAFNKLKRLNIISYKVDGNAFEWIEISPYIMWQGEATTHNQKMQMMRESFGKMPFESKMFFD